jgi:hypothetical protein
LSVHKDSERRNMRRALVYRVHRSRSSS